MGFTLNLGKLFAYFIIHQTFKFNDLETDCEPKAWIPIMVTFVLASTSNNIFKVHIRNYIDSSMVHYKKGQISQTTVSINLSKCHFIYSIIFCTWMMILAQSCLSCWGELFHCTNGDRCLQTQGYRRPSIAVPNLFLSIIALKEWFTQKLKWFHNLLMLKSSKGYIISDEYNKRHIN